MKKIVYAIIAFVMIALSGTTHATDVKAEDVINLHVGGTYSFIPSLVNTGSGFVQKSEGGGSVDPSSLGGRPLSYLYCVDLFTNVYVNNDYPSTTVNNAALIHGAPLINAGKVAYLLENYGVDGQGDQAIALQAAIWYEIYGPEVYKLDVNGSTSNTATLYNKYLDEAAITSNSGDVSKFLWINPGNTSGTTYQGLVTSSPNPEPGTIMLFGVGMLGLIVFGKRRMNKAA